MKNIYDFNHRQGAYANVPDNLNGQVGTMVDGREVIGLKAGDYIIEPDAQGQIDGSIRVNKFRPYIGLGFGRAVPRHRINFCFDLGVQFWGKPSVIANDKKVTKGDLEGDADIDKTFNAIDKMVVCPVLSFRIIGRIF